VEDIITGRLVVVCQIAVPKIRTFSCSLMTLVGFVFRGHRIDTIVLHAPCLWMVTL